nr:hypothetical protein [Tanacetum cinerariifolium]
MVALGLDVTIYLLDLYNQSPTFGCGGEKCKKGVVRKNGSLWCQACEKAVDYPVLGFWLELDVSDKTASTIVVMFDEPAKELLKCFADSLAAADDESGFGYVDHAGLPLALANIIGTTHTLEMKSHTYYEHGTFESFTCLRIPRRGGRRRYESSNMNTSAEGADIGCNMKGYENEVNLDSHHTKSFSSVLGANQTKKLNFRTLVNNERVEDANFVLSMSAIQFGLHKIMKNDDGFYFFKFDSKEGLEQVLERGPWMNRHILLILTKWTPSISLTKEGVTKVPVWVKMHKVPVVAYSEDGLSLIATQIRKPIMLDAFTSSMCVESWGRVSFARALIEVSVDSDLKNEVIMAIPNEKGNGMDDQCDGFTKVKRRKNKGSKDNKNPNSRNVGGFRYTKPKPNSYRPKKVPKPAQGKQVKPNSNPFNALHSLGEEDSGEAPNLLCATKHGEGNEKFKSPICGGKKKLVFSPKTKIHYFERDDVADMDQVVKTSEYENDGVVSKHTSSSWNEDSE